MDSVIYLVELHSDARFKKPGSSQAIEILMTASPLPIHRNSNQHLGQALKGFHSFSPAPEKAPLHLVAAEGQLQVHTAPYRGSFSGVLSEAIRTAGLGRKVIIAQFLKGGVNQGPKGVVSLCGRLEWLRPDIACCLVDPSPEQTTGQSISIPRKAVEVIWEICRDHLLNGDLDQLVLDEAGLATQLGYLKEDDLISTLEQRPRAMDVILTGPSIPSQVMAMADQVTELRCGF